MKAIRFVSLTCTVAALVWARTAEGQRRIPEQLKRVTTMLRTLHEDDLANTVESDYRAGRLTIGPTAGANGVTGVEVMDRIAIIREVGGATGLSNGNMDNGMTISERIMDIHVEPGSERLTSVTETVAAWALTLRHEYVHMGQFNPRPVPRFEDPAYQMTMRAGVTWYRTAKAELEEITSGPPSRENLARAKELRRIIGAIAKTTNENFNDMPDRVAEGNMSPNQVWTTLDGERVRGNAAAQERNYRIIDDDAREMDEEVQDFEREVNDMNAPSSGTGVARTGGRTTGGTSGGGAKPPTTTSETTTSGTSKAGTLIDQVRRNLGGTKPSTGTGGATTVAATSGGVASAPETAVPSASGAASAPTASSESSRGASSSSPAPASGGASTSLTLELPNYWGHLSYTISGAQLDPPSGGDRGKVAGRSYTGRLTGSTLIVSGTAVSDNESSGPGSSDYYEVVVEVNVGKEHGYYGYIAQKGEKLNKPFNVRVPIPAGATSGTFSISLLEQNQNWGTYGWVVTGTLKR